MSWVTFIALTFLIFGQHYMLYPYAWKAVWRKVKGWFGA